MGKWCQQCRSSSRVFGVVADILDIIIIYVVFIEIEIISTVTQIISIVGKPIELGGTGFLVSASMFTILAIIVFSVGCVINQYWGQANTFDTEDTMIQNKVARHFPVEMNSRTLTGARVQSKTVRCDCTIAKPFPV